MSARFGPRPFTVLVAAVAVLAVASPAAGAADASQQPTAAEILDRVEQRYENADTVTGTAVVTTSNESTTVESNVSFAYADPDSSRLLVERDGATYRTGSNGTVGWAVGPQGSAVWDADGPDAPAGDQVPGTGVPASDQTLAWAVPTDVDADDADATLVGQTRVDGVPVYELDVRPDGSDGAATTLWVAQDDYRVLQAATTGADRLTVVDVGEVRFDVSVHESTFRPPADRIDSWSIDRYESYDEARNATDLALPRLATGEFVEATVTKQRNETIVGQRYVLDGQNVTVVSTAATDRFEEFTENATQVDVDGRNASVAEFRDGSVVVWTEDGVTTAVVVEGSPDRAVEIARQVSE